MDVETTIGILILGILKVSSARQLSSNANRLEIMIVVSFSLAPGSLSTQACLAAPIRKRQTLDEWWADDHFCGRYYLSQQLNIVVASASG